MLRKLATCTALVAAALLLFTSCSSAAPSAPSPLQGSGSSAPAAPAAPAANLSGTAQDSQPSTDRMVIITANLQVEVTDVSDFIAKVGSLAKEMGGYIVSSENQQQGTDRVGKVSVRVPSARMDEALGQIRGFASRVGRETVSNKDVTEEYVDQDARLRTLKATEDQYIQLMKTTTTTEDIIKVQQSLQQVRQQIEQTQGRINYLQRNSEMAVINVDVSTVGASRPVTSGAWNLLDVANVAVQALVGLALFLAGVAVWILVFLPIWGPIALLVLWWRRRGARWSRRGPSTKGGPPPQPSGA